jgi:hypothetical protein
MLEPYAGKPARTVLRGLGRPQGLPGYPTLWSNTPFVRFQELRITLFHTDICRTIDSPVPPGGSVLVRGLQSALG